MEPLTGRTPRDQNRVPASFGVSSVDGVTTEPFEVNPSTGRLLVDAAVTSGGGGTTNITQLGGNNISLNTGAADAGTQREVLSNDYLSTAIVKITDGTNTANVQSIATGQSALTVTGGRQELSGLSAGSLNADLVAATDVSNFAWFSLQITGTFSGTLTFNGSNDNVNFNNVAVVNVTSTTAGPTASQTSTGVFHGSCSFRYLRVRMTAYTSGTANGTLELFTSPKGYQTLGVIAAMSGVWTVQPGNTPNTTPWLVTNTASAAGGYVYNHQSANGTTTIKSGSGTLHSVTVNNAGTTDTITLYDNTAGSGTVIAVIGSSSEATFMYDIAFTTGLTAVIAGTTSPDVTFSFK